VNTKRLEIASVEKHTPEPQPEFSYNTA